MLEVGAGLGTMVARLIDWRLLGRADYTLLDVEQELLDDARGWLLTWAGEHGLRAAANPEGIRIAGDPGMDVQVRFVQAEINTFVSAAPQLPRADLLIANAVLDLVEVPVLLPPLFQLAVPRGLYWFSVNYDGETIFQPEHPDDDLFMRLYNRSMDERVRYGRPAGESRTGRHLFAHLRAAGASIAAAGPSDWVVHAGDRGYPGDEAHFLHLIVDTVHEALRQYPEADSAAGGQLGGAAQPADRPGRAGLPDPPARLSRPLPLGLRHARGAARSSRCCSSRLPARTGRSTDRCRTTRPAPRCPRSRASSAGGAARWWTRRGGRCARWARTCITCSSCSPMPCRRATRPWPRRRWPPSITPSA